MIKNEFYWFSEEGLMIKEKKLNFFNKTLKKYILVNLFSRVYNKNEFTKKSDKKSYKYFLMFHLITIFSQSEKNFENLS